MSVAAEHEVPLERLEAEIQRLARELSQRLEQWLRLVAEFDRRGGARRWGFRGTAEWLAFTCGVGHRAAREHVRVARQLVERPLVRAALATGELSYSKVRAITRAADVEGDAELVELARTATASEVERVVRGLRSAASARVDLASGAHARRYLDWCWEDDGSLAFRGRLAGEEAVAFVEAIETGAAALHPAAARGLSCRPALEAAGSAGERPPDPPSPAARRADALSEIVLSGCPRTQVVLHVDEAALGCTAATGDKAAGEICAFEDAPAAPSETARRLTCDGELIAATRDGHGSNVDYGRRRRVVPPPLRLALERRDRCCRFPGCERRHGLHAHHIRHWAHGGATDRENLILLCRFHHRLVHEGGFSVGRRAGAVEFRRPDGWMVPGAARSGRTGERGPPVAAAA